ncbi:PREDICTED: allatotropin-like [Papilio xuthus]|uniref:Allatotropin-like n=1 Tax=Papilio xuthus TaxID=66420 RepID=A0AAJ6ZGM9_PAPXU|nr:PREDICTED: allatotropin-like [Papilio xuthus]
MNISMQVVIVVAAMCLCLADGAPEARMTRKQQRPTRGFKNVEMMTARGFGKRDRPSARTERDVEHQSSSERASRGTPTFKSPTVGIARDFGKRTPEVEYEDNFDAPRKIFRPKTKLMVASDFGKRSGYDDINDEEVEIRVTRGTFKPNSNILIARGYGKRDETRRGRVFGLENIWESLENMPEKDNQENDDKVIESIPVDWFVNEMLNNPDFARSVVRKFVDLNQDGALSSEELLRNVV